MRTSVIVLIGVATGWFVAYQYYAREIAQMQLEQATVVKEAQKNHAKKLAQATDTILRAQEDYNSMRAERDRALERLRNNRGGGNEGRSIQALRTRVAELEKLVEQLARAGSKCDDGWQRCAAKHDALAEAVR